MIHFCRPIGLLIVHQDFTFPSLEPLLLGSMFKRSKSWIYTKVKPRSTKIIDFISNFYIQQSHIVPRKLTFLMRGRSHQPSGVSHFWVILDTLNLIVKIFNIYIYDYIYMRSCWNPTKKHNNYSLAGRRAPDDVFSVPKPCMGLEKLKQAIMESVLPMVYHFTTSLSSPVYLSGFTPPHTFKYLIYIFIKMR